MINLHLCIVRYCNKYYVYNIITIISMQTNMSVHHEKPHGNILAAFYIVPSLKQEETLVVVVAR